MIVECPQCLKRYDVTGRPPGTKARCRCGMLFLLPPPQQSAGALHCPDCGGNVKTGAHRCEYCESALLVKACPRCFARIFHGAKHCDQCGAQVDVAANANRDGTAKQLHCPRCEEPSPMVARLVGNTMLDECPACLGIWLDSAGVERLVKDRKGACTTAVLGMGRSETRIVAGDGKLSSRVPQGRMYVSCPECSTVMNRTNFAKRSGIIIDTCKGHGTWFDRDELPRVVEFVMNGGIDAANQDTLRELRKDARRERAKLRATQNESASGMAWQKNDSLRKAGIFGGVLEIIGIILS